MMWSNDSFLGMWWRSGSDVDTILECSSGPTPDSLSMHPTKNCSHPTT